MKMHESITTARIIEACERASTSLDNPGFCIECGAEIEGVDPDARGDKCEECDAHGVYGAEELALMSA